MDTLHRSIERIHVSHTWLVHLVQFSRFSLGIWYMTLCVEFFSHIFTILLFLFFKTTAMTSQKRSCAIILYV